MRLASTQLTAMAEGAGLRLSFSTERSVQDELARESTSGELPKGLRGGRESLTLSCCWVVHQASCLAALFTNAHCAPHNARIALL